MLVILLLWLPETTRVSLMLESLSPGAYNIDGSNSGDHSYDNRYHPLTRINHMPL